MVRTSERQCFSPSPQKEGEDNRFQEEVAVMGVSYPTRCGPPSMLPVKHNNKERIRTRIT
jgi:hypothetical protein